MPHRTKAKILERVNELNPELFYAVDGPEREAVVGFGRLRHAKAGTILKKQSETAGQLYLLLYGRVKFYASEGEEQTFLRWVMPGEPVGLAAISVHWPVQYQVAAEAVEDSILLAWGHYALEIISRQYPRVLENSLHIATNYIGEYRDLHHQATHGNAGRRLAKALARRIAEKGTAEFAVTNQQLADEAGTSLFFVSRLLAEWHRKGYVVKGRGKLVVLTLDGLVDTKEEL